MDILTPLTNLAAVRQHDDSICIPSATCVTTNGGGGNGGGSSGDSKNIRIKHATTSTTTTTTATTGDGVSLNARRLKLRNAGFRAALLPARRLSPPQQTGLGGGVVFVKSENIENATVGGVKTRRHQSNYSDTATPPLNILQEIRNCSQRKSVPRSPLGDLFGFADDEDEDVDGQHNTNAMSSKTGSIKASKSRKTSRRVSSFQSTKYIEYLENELGLATRKLETLQPSETVGGQAAKIRKLEKRTQELSEHITDWEKNFEERVNDQVFERLHGESDLRLKILTLEQAAAHKETHIEELGKELDDVKAKLEEAESIETTLSRRIDVLTELLAKSPTRTSFASANSEFPTPTKPTKPLMHRIPTSPTRCSQRIEDLDGTLRIDDVALLSNTSNIFNLQANESAIDTDTESQDFNIFSRPTSGIFSSRSSQTSSSRPTSMFSTASANAWTSADEKPPGRARKSRRFAPGSAGLKPLLLASNAGLQSPPRLAGISRKENLEPQSSNESCWESAEDLRNSTSKRPRTRRPYSWAYSPAITKHKSIMENEESEEDTFIANAAQNDDLPAYLRHLATDESSWVTSKSKASVSPPAANRSLYQELNTEQPFVDSSDDLIQVCDSSAPEIISQNSPDSSSPLVEQSHCLQLDTQEVVDNSFESELSKTIIKCDFDQHRIEPPSPLSISSLSLVIDRPQTPYLTNLIVTLKQKPLNLARGILLHSWFQGSARIGRLIRRVVDLFLVPRRKVEPFRSSPISTTTCPGLSSSYPSLLSRAPEPVATVKTGSADCNGNDKPKNKLDIVKLLTKLQAFAFPASNHQRPRHCSCCTEPRGKRSLQLWSKLILALVVAIGCAVLEGPAAVLDTGQPNQCTKRTLPPVRNDEE